MIYLATLKRFITMYEIVQKRYGIALNQAYHFNNYFSAAKEAFPTKNFNYCDEFKFASHFIIFLLLETVYLKYKMTFRTFQQREDIMLVHFVKKISSQK